MTRTPKNMDRAFADLSAMLWGNRNHPTYWQDLLPPERMDYTLDSLLYFDRYLARVHDKPPGPEDFVRLALRGGAYLGEVIRRTASRRIHWLGFSQAAEVSERIRAQGLTLAATGVLWSPDDDLCFPIGKVERALRQGPGESLHRFAVLVIAAGVRARSA